MMLCRMEVVPRLFAFRRFRGFVYLKGAAAMSNPVFQFAHRFDQVSGSAIREIFKVIAQPGMISFAGGNPAPEAIEETGVCVFLL